MSKKFSFKTTKAKSAEAIKESSSRGGMQGRALWVPKDGEVTFRIIAEPKDWYQYSYIVVEDTDDGRELGFRGKMPIFEGMEEMVPESSNYRERVSYQIPVIAIDSETDEPKFDGKVLLYEPVKKVLNDLLEHHKRKRTLTDRDYTVVREGTGRNTTYTTLPEDKTDRKVKSIFSTWQDEAEDVLASELERNLRMFFKAYDPDAVEEAAEEQPAKKATKKRKRTLEVEESVEDTDDEDEDDVEDADDEDVEGDESESTFVVSDIDTKTWTADFTDTESGKVFESVYLDRNRDEVEELIEGGSYEFVITIDEDGDNVAATAPVLVKKPAAKKRKATKK